MSKKPNWRIDCPTCGGVTRVKNTGRAGVKISRKLNLDWFVDRDRVCVDCGNTVKTVELLVDDLFDLMAPQPAPEMTMADVVKFLIEYQRKET